MQISRKEKTVKIFLSNFRKSNQMEELFFDICHLALSNKNDP